MTLFSVATDRHDDVPVVRPAGHLDHASLPAFSAELRRAVESAADRAVLDLSGVSFVSSMAWGTMLSCAGIMRRKGGSLLLCGMQRAVRSAYDLLSLGGTLRIFPTAEDALHPESRG